jgi:hypothetical protein
MIDETIAHYRITAKLDEGGMGEVHHAIDTKLRRVRGGRWCITKAIHLVV